MTANPYAAEQLLHCYIHYIVMVTLLYTLYCYGVHIYHHFIGPIVINSIDIMSELWSHRHNTY